jgi:MotA/TolQ/ExbB proton channel family
MKTMLTFSIIELHNDGGPIFMIPLSLLLIINIGLVIYSIFSLTQKKAVAPKYVEAIRQIGALAAAFGAACTILGLFEAFSWLASHEEGSSFQVIMGGMKVAIITAMYGLFIFCLSMLAYIIFKLTARN